MAYLGDLLKSPGRISTPRSQGKALQVIEKARNQGRQDRHNKNWNMGRAKREIKDLKSLVKHLTEMHTVPFELAKVLKVGGEPAIIVYASKTQDVTNREKIKNI